MQTSVLRISAPTFVWTSGYADDVVSASVEAGVEIAGYLLAVEVLADKDYLLHAVAIGFVPVTHKSRLLRHKLPKFLLGSGGIPLPHICYFFLYAGLLKQIGHIGIVAEVAYTFGPDNI